MQYGWEFLWSVIASSAGTTLLLGVAGWLFRGQISHWLNKDLEAAKAGHQRDLESYKVTLIAAVERAKAAQEVRRTGAVKVLEMEFAAIQQFEVARRNLATDVVSAGTMPAEHKTLEQHQVLMNRLEKYREASALLGVFLQIGQRRALLELRSAILEATQYCQPGAEPLAGQQLDVLQTKVLSLDLAIDALISVLINRMQSLD